MSDDRDRRKDEDVEEEEPTFGDAEPDDAVDAEDPDSPDP